MPRFRLGRNLPAGGRTFRFFFATDLHGSEVCFKKFLAAATVYKVDALVMGGDVTGKTLIPLVSRGSRVQVGSGESSYEIDSDSGVRDLIRQAGDRGAYCVYLRRDEVDRLGNDEGFLTGVLHDAARSRAASWVELAEERLKGTGVQCFVSGGNDDSAEVLEPFADESLESVVFCDGQVVNVSGDLDMLSVGYSNPTPWHTPREMAEGDLEALIDDVARSVRSMDSCVFNLHVPPFASGLDSCAKLDTSTDPPTPVRVGGSLMMDDAGSTAVRSCLTRHQPLVGVHGHIHESRAVSRIGQTTVLNPGSESGEGTLRGAILAVNGSRTVRHQFTSG
jgi:Icc-related predicted phosphoesterase